MMLDQAIFLYFSMILFTFSMGMFLRFLIKIIGKKKLL